MNLALPRLKFSRSTFVLSLSWPCKFVQNSLTDLDKSIAQTAPPRRTPL